MQLGDDDVLVVARVADERAALLVARQVVSVIAAVARRCARRAASPAGASLSRVQSYRNGWSIGPDAVERVEVEARRAEVDAARRGRCRASSFDVGSNVMS